MGDENKQRVVIVGGGFGGLNVVRGLRDAPVQVTLIDKRNFHLFQPLLYQVATGELSAADIAHPLRVIFSKNKNVTVLKAEVIDVDPRRRQVLLANDRAIDYDILVVATGSTHHYFGNDAWAEYAPGLKMIEDALHIRCCFLSALETAELEPDPQKRQDWLTFVVVGGGPTGVELSGALAELVYHGMAHDFRNVDVGQVKIILIENDDRLLTAYPPELSAAAEKTLAGLGVTIQTQTKVTGIQEGLLLVKRAGQAKEDRIQAKTIMWGAGMKASPLGEILAKATGAQLDRGGRVMVEPDLSIPNHPDIFVIGDLANFSHQQDKPLPGLATVAMQQGSYVARRIKAAPDKTPAPFRYSDKGAMAIIGRNAAVADIKSWHFSGFFAWLIWLVVHIYYLIGFDNKVLVLFQWAWNYITFRQGARLITNEKHWGLNVHQPHLHLDRDLRNNSYAAQAIVSRQEKQP
jgi:NADH dehydrogenase